MGVLAAASALKALLHDPEDTSQVFHVIEALSGQTGARITRRMRRSMVGRRILAERPDVLAKLRDREYLRTLPAESMGAHYLAFCDAEGITADGLVAASETGNPNKSDDADVQFVGSRMRDTHDLWHVVTGYHGDLIGEASLLAFTFAQTRNRGVGLIVAAALLKMPERALRALVIDGFRRGRRAAWLPEVAWEQLLASPLSDVRRTLNVGPIPTYAPIRTSDLTEPIRIL